MNDKLTYELSDKEYKEFIHWFHGTYVKMRKAGPGRNDFSCLKEPVEMTVKEEIIHARSGACEAYILYGAIERLYKLETLFVFYDMMRFWAVPKRLLGREEEAIAWRADFERRIKEMGKMRISFQEAADICADSRFAPCRYIRQIEEVKAEYGLLRVSRREMEHLRKLGTFPYRMIGEQMVAAGRRGLIEITERAAVIHPYENITGVFYTKQTLYLAEKEGEGLLLPLGALGGMEGAEALMRVCDARCRFNNPAFRLKKKSVPLTVRWTIPGKAAAAICGVAAVAAGAMILGALNGVNGSGGIKTSVFGAPMTGSGERAADSGEVSGSELLVVIPDDAVFDAVTEDGSFVSSSMFYRITLPGGGWEISQDQYNSFDALRSDWGQVSVTGGLSSAYEGYDVTEMLPKSKAEYIAKTYGGAAAFDSEVEVIDYNLEKSGEWTIVSREIRSKDGDGVRHVIGLDVYGPKRYYSLSITPEREDDVSLQTARAVRDSFRAADTSVGICRSMEEKIFHGYYGDNVYMTSCLVLMDHAMSDEEIAEKLREVKKIRNGAYPLSGDALAVRTPESKWLGIDCPSLQQNCTKEAAKAVARIFQSEVILYDEFDGDLLMVAYSDADQKHAYERAAANGPWILESEFQIYGKEQNFPEDLLKYMDISKEEAEAIWKDSSYVFQMEKWVELVGHMTKMPVPEEFVGFHGAEALDEAFRVVKE